MSLNLESKEKQTLLPWCTGATEERKGDKNKYQAWGGAGIVLAMGSVFQLETETLVKSLPGDSGTQSLSKTGN